MENSIWAPKRPRRLTNRLAKRRAIEHLRQTNTEITTKMDPVTKSHSYTNAKSGSRLLKLPPEIRVHIWCNILISSTGFIKPIFSGEIKKGKDNKYTKKIHYQEFDNDMSGRIKTERVNLSIFFAKDKELYYECAFVFWRENTFILDPLKQYGFPQALDLSTSIYRKIQHVQINFNLSHSDLLLFPVGGGSRRDDIKSALATLQTIRDQDQGSLKSLTIKPLGTLVDLEIAIDAIRLGPRYELNLLEIMHSFHIFNESLMGAGVKRKVEIDLCWYRMELEEQRQFCKDYENDQIICPTNTLANPQASSLLKYFAMYMGGSNSGLWVDGKLCYETVNGKVETRADPFLLKEAPKEEAASQNLGGS